MEYASEREQVIRRYVLGQLSDAERQVIELRVLTDPEYFTESLLVEDEIIEDLILGALPTHDQEKAEHIFSLNSERNEKLTLTAAIVKYASESDAKLWEEILAEASRNRRLLATLLENDWLGLRLLDASCSNPSTTETLAKQFHAEARVVRSSLSNLSLLGVVEERINGIFSCTREGKELLEKFEECTDSV